MNITLLVSKMQQGKNSISPCPLKSKTFRISPTIFHTQIKYAIFYFPRKKSVKIHDKKHWNTTALVDTKHSGKIRNHVS